MKTPLTYGVFSALVLCAISLLLYFLGFHSDPSKIGVGNGIGTAAGYLVPIPFIVLAMRARRAEIPATEGFSYGRALGVGVLVALVSAVVGAVYYGIYISVINPELIDTMLAYQTTKWEAANMNSQQIEGAEKVMRMVMKPFVMVPIAILWNTFYGTIVSLIAAAFIKRAAVPPQPPIGTPTVA
jgi:multisubunit Na+/H+ antiporter MnhB subunit